ncbi:MAG: type II secretion system F family protein, partial [Candidatus Sericytochromatia bacterium]|nr:type II secretion system F family protein [Candidatus Tanganyikabacteria bacterium]
MLSAKERALLFRELGDMLRAGLPVERTMSVAAKARRGKMAEVLALMAQRVRKGESLEDAFMAAERRYPGHFSKWEIRYIGFGEKAGRLPEFLLQIAEQAEEAWSLTMELISSCAYPLLLLYISILVGPLAKLILKGPLPYIAEIWFPLIAVTAGLAGLGIAFRHTTYRRAILGALRPVPALGKVVNLASQLRLISGLGLAYRSGIPIN